MKRAKSSSRRSFLKGTAGGLLGATLDGGVPGLTLADASLPFLQTAGIDWQAIDALPTNVTRTWLGPSYWANRLQDWRLHEGRLECLTGAAGDEVRTVAVLTREIIAGNKPAYLSVRTGLLSGGEVGGFGGFLLGAGGGELDYRAAVLVQKASGIGGGLMFTCAADGRLQMRDHSDEGRPLACAEPLPATPGTAPNKLTAQDDVLLRLDILPQGQGAFRVEFSAWDQRSGKQLASLANRDVPEAKLLGGIALVSSPYTGKDGARYWFRDLRTGGEKIAVRPAVNDAPPGSSATSNTLFVLSPPQRQAALSDEQLEAGWRLALPARK